MIEQSRWDPNSGLLGMEVKGAAGSAAALR